MRATWLYCLLLVGPATAQELRPLLELRPDGAAPVPLFFSEQLEGNELALWGYVEGRPRERWRVKIDEETTSLEVPVVQPDGTVIAEVELFLVGTEQRLDTTEDGLRLVLQGGRWFLLPAFSEDPVFPQEGEVLVIEVDASDTDPGGESPATDEPSMLRDLKNAMRTASINDPGARPAEVVRAAIRDPATLNSVLQSVAKRAPDRWNLLEELNVSFKAFGEGSENSIGIGYDFDTSFELEGPGPGNEADGNRYWGLDYSLSARGNVAFENDINPQDFLEARATFNYFSSAGGVNSAENWTDEDATKFLDLATRAASYRTDEEFLASEEWAELRELTKDRFGTQIYWELGIDGGIESDQRFDSKHYLFGAHAALDVKAWSRNSIASQLNLFDHPFAFVRLLTGYDETYTPRGTAIPTVVVGLDYVATEGDDPRMEVGDVSDFWRVRTEVAFKTPIARDPDNEYFVAIDWRYYWEPNASSAVRAADLDGIDHFRISIESESGLFVSYGSGQLPFDIRDRDYFELGWKFNL